MFTFLKSGFQKLKNSLKKTSSFLGKKLTGVFSRPIDPSSLDEIESILYEADIGSKTIEEFITHITLYHKEHQKASAEDYLNELQKLSEKILLLPPSVGGNTPLIGTPQVILIVGVNGTGKTTTIAKLAKLYKDEGKKVLLAAADTFRAAASSQLETWAKRLDIEIVTSQSGTDPSSVLYDAMAKGKAKGFDIILCDSAGRLLSLIHI